MTRRGAHSFIEGVIKEPQHAPTMAEGVAARLRALIIDGQLPAGTPLLLTPLAERLQVSVMPVREALRILEAEALVVVTPRRGAVVSEPSLEEAEEIYTIRIALEALCARQAAQRLTEADVAAIQDSFAQMAAAARSGDTRGFVDFDHEFHFRLYRVSGRERLVQSIADLVSRSLRYVPYLHRAREMQEDPLEAHRPLLRAIEHRDALLIEELTRRHMTDAMGRLLASIRHAKEERAAPSAVDGHTSPTADLASAAPDTVGAAEASTSARIDDSG